MTKIRVNKIEAARRQIDAAIRMLFNNEDPVAIHTVATAAFRILRDLADGIDTPRWKQFDQMIKPELRREFWQRMNKPANFFKHADRDRDDVLDNVDEEYNDATIFLAMVIYEDLGYQPTAEMRAFFGWFAMAKPHFFLEHEQLTRLLSQGHQLLAEMNLSRAERLALGKQSLQHLKTARY